MPAVTTAIELARIAQIGVLIVTLAVVGARVNRWWCTQWRCLLPAAGTGLISLLISAGAVDALVHKRPGGVATYLVLLASVALLLQACTIGVGGVHPEGGHAPTGAYQVQRRPRLPMRRKDRTHPGQ